MASALKITASDFYSYFRPSKCDLRIFLRHRQEPEAEPSPYEEVIRRLGERHEREHLKTLPSAEDLSKKAREEREQLTIQAVKNEVPVIYQSAMRASTTIGGVECEIVGDPDFLIKTTDSYAIRDSKMSRRITEKDHPEIIYQLGIYGWLYESTFGKPPHALEVHSGTGEIVAVTYDRGIAALALLEALVAVKQLESEPYSPVGWSKCNGCGFYEKCWPRAESSGDVALVFGVDQGLAIALRDKGINTAQQLVSAFDEAHLADFQRPHGKNLRRVGKSAASILRMADALVSKKESVLQTPSIPDSPNYVMFDLEGLPPQLDELDKVYLWGTQVFGNNPESFQAATAGFGPDGDREGWASFLSNAGSVFTRHGDVPFVHWHHYERVKLDGYVERYGDPNGIAERIKKNLLDLLPITRDSIALPLPSYSLKVVEKYVGFKRTLREYGGDWAMAKYIEATETRDQKVRDDVMQEILAYNREDLEATWAVLQWLKKKVA